MNMKPEFFCYRLGPSDPSFFGLTFVERLDVTQIQTDADFEVKRLSCFVSRDGSPQTDSSRELPTGILFNIRDNATGRTLFSSYADTGELFGDGRIPFVLPTTHFFRRGSQAQVLYAPVAQQGPDFDNANVWLVMIGAKHFT